MRTISALHQYLVRLPSGKLILWCYLIWYLTIVTRYFDATPGIWLNSAGISAVIGFALLLSVGGTGTARADRWQTVRLFLMPFCVSSFSSLIKGKGFFLIVPPNAADLLAAVGGCLLFVSVVMALKMRNPMNESGKM
jgi:hypothetical protein